MIPFRQLSQSICPITNSPKNNQMNVENLLTIYQYHKWANNRIFRKVAKLTPEQLNTPNNLTGGSLFDTLVHMYDAEWSWRLAAQEGAMSGKILTGQDFPDFASCEKTGRPKWKTWLVYIQTLHDDHLHNYTNSPGLPAPDPAGESCGKCSTTRQPQHPSSG